MGSTDLAAGRAAMPSIHRLPWWYMTISAIGKVSLLTFITPGSGVAKVHQQAPEVPTVVIRVVATADTVLCPATTGSAAGSAPSLRVGQGGGYAEDGHLLIRFDDLPAVAARDVLQIRLGIYREWRGSGYDDADEIVKLVDPVPGPFSEAPRPGLPRRLSRNPTPRFATPRRQCSWVRPRAVIWS